MARRKRDWPSEDQVVNMLMREVVDEMSDTKNPNRERGVQ